MYLKGELGLLADVRVQLALSFDTKTAEIRADAVAGFGLGSRITAEGGVFVAPSSRDSTSIGIDLTAQAGAAASFKPAPVGGAAEGSISLLGGRASTVHGLEGGAMQPAAEVEANVGPFKVSNENMGLSLGPDVGVSATVNVEAALSVSFEPIIDIMRDREKE